MIINILVFIILGILDILSIINKEDEDKKIEATHKIVFGIFLIIQTIAYSYEDVLNKIALEKDYFTPYSFYKVFFDYIIIIS